jgi:hypothetical protein
MEAIFLGFALGAGSVIVWRRGRERLRAAARWTVRHAGWVSGQVAQAVDAAKVTLREEYARGRTANLTRFAEGPPPSSRSANGKATAKSEHHDA